MTSPLVDGVAAARRELELRWAREEERELELTETEKWARDPIGWMNSGHVWIASKFGEDGSELSKVRPIRLRLFPTQEATIGDWLDLDHLAKTGELRFRNFAAEKSRQIGETWAFAATITWILHYHAAAGGAIHRKSSEIDDGGERNTWRSLFGKVRYIDRHLDRGKLPGLGRLAFRPFSREPAKVENLLNGSVIYGEGQTDDPFRGLTLDYLFGDEAAFLEHGERVYASIDEACPHGKALVSTVNGDGNMHARICDEKPAGWRVRRLHWSQHPVYAEGLHVAGDDPDCKLCDGVRQGIDWNPQAPRAHRYPGRLASPWYDSRVIGKTDEQVANELDIDRERALGGRVYPEFQSEIHVRPGPLFDPELAWKTELAFDYGLDVTSVVICQDAPEDYRIVGLLEMGDLFGTTASPERVSAELFELLGRLGFPDRFLVPEWTRRLYAIGDPYTGRSIDTARTMAESYRRHGWEIQTPSRRDTGTIEPSITAAKQLMLGSPKPLRVCDLNAADFALHARNNTWKLDGVGRRTSILNDDKHNHTMRAFAYLAVAKWPPREAGEQDRAIDADEVNVRRHRPGVNTDMRVGMTL